MCSASPYDDLPSIGMTLLRTPCLLCSPLANPSPSRFPFTSTRNVRLPSSLPHSRQSVFLDRYNQGYFQPAQPPQPAAPAPAPAPAAPREQAPVIEDAAQPPAEEEGNEDIAGREDREDGQLRVSEELQRVRTAEEWGRAGDRGKTIKSEDRK